MRSWIGFLTMFSSIAIASAQDSPIATTETLHVGTQLVLLDASVKNRKTGKAILGLTPADFMLTEDGAPQTVTSLTQNQLPLSILFLFDATDTVQPVLWPLALGARRVLGHLHPDDEVEVATFSTHVTVVQKFTADHARIAMALGDASGVYDKSQATFIDEDLFEATELASAAKTRDSRRVEIWLTDGTSNYDDEAMNKDHAHGAPAVLHTQQQATDLLLHSDVVVSALVQRSSLTEAERHQPAHSRFGDIEHYAELTGGPVQYATAAEIADRFSALLDELRERYTLGYKPAQPKPSGTLCKLGLTLSPAFFAAHPDLRHKDISIRSRRSYTR